MDDDSAYLRESVLLLCLQLRKSIGPRALPAIQRTRASVRAEVLGSLGRRRIRESGDDPRRDWRGYDIGSILAIGIRHHPRDGRRTRTDTALIPQTFTRFPTSPSPCCSVRQALDMAGRAAYY